MIRKIANCLILFPLNTRHDHEEIIKNITMCAILSMPKIGLISADGRFVKCKNATNNNKKTVIKCWVDLGNDSMNSLIFSDQ